MRSRVSSAAPTRIWSDLRYNAASADRRIRGIPMKRRLVVSLSILALVLTLPLVALGDVTVGAGGGTPGTSLNFQLVGSNPLFGRGMNAAMTIYDHYAYIGNRTDGSSTCGF